VPWCIFGELIGLLMVAKAPPFGLIVLIVAAVFPWWCYAGALLLDDTGFIYEWPFWQSQKFLWIDVDHFEITAEKNEEDRVLGNVVFDYAPKQGTWGGKWMKANYGHHLGLQDRVINTGLTPDLLLRLMTAWRERALRH
jgi:hypothetical protein